MASHPVTVSGDRPEPASASTRPEGALAGSDGALAGSDGDLAVSDGGLAVSEGSRPAGPVHPATSHTTSETTKVVRFVTRETVGGAASPAQRGPTNGLTRPTNGAFAGEAPATAAG